MAKKVTKVMAKRVTEVVATEVTETKKEVSAVKKEAVKDKKPLKAVTVKPVLGKPAKIKTPEPVEEFKSAPPLFIPKEKVKTPPVAKKTTPVVEKMPEKDPEPEPELEPVTVEEIEETMRYLAPRLRDPKTKDGAEKELKDFHVRMRKAKHHPKW